MQDAPSCSLRLLARPGRPGAYIFVPETGATGDCLAVLADISHGASAVDPRWEIGTAPSSVHDEIVELIDNVLRLARATDQAGQGDAAGQLSRKCLEYGDYLERKCAENHVSAPSGWRGGVRFPEAARRKSLLRALLRRPEPELVPAAAPLVAQVMSEQVRHLHSLVVTELPRMAEHEPSSTVTDPAWRLRLESGQDGFRFSAADSGIEAELLRLRRIVPSTTTAPPSDVNATVIGLLRDLGAIWSGRLPAAPALKAIVDEHVAYHSGLLTPLLGRSLDALEERLPLATDADPATCRAVQVSVEELILHVGNTAMSKGETSGVA